MMLLKSPAGWVSVTRSVSALGADSPEIWCAPCQAATAAAVTGGAPLALKCLLSAAQ